MNLITYFILVPPSDYFIIHVPAGGDQGPNDSV